MKKIMLEYYPEDEAELPSELLSWGKLECRLNASLVHINSTIIIYH
jgi:hypothetical protein